MSLDLTALAVVLALIVFWAFLPERFDPAMWLKRAMEDFLRGGECRRLGHAWEFVGGRNAGCDLKDCACSVPVYRCEICDDFDYGDNPEADRVREECEARING